MARRSGFGGNAWNAEVMALALHALFPHRDVVVFHYRGYAPSSGRPSARALFSDSLMIFDHLERTQGGERIIPVGFSIGAAVAAYLARHRHGAARLCAPQSGTWSLRAPSTRGTTIFMTILTSRRRRERLS